MYRPYQLSAISHHLARPPHDCSFTLSMTDHPRILVADDQPDVLQALELLGKNEGYHVTAVSSPRAVLEAVQSEEFDAALIDLNYARDTTSGAEGLQLLPKLEALDSTLPVVVMTAWGSIEGAVEAIRRGARDYVEKPWDNDRLVTLLNTHVELGRALRATRRLSDANRLLRKEGYPEFIAESPAMEPVKRLLERIGPSDANVLITGEHGTGKEVIALWLHAASERAKHPLVTVNIGGLAEQVFESELFGHVKGAFTDAKSDRLGRFEMADRGTLFLDEIADLPPSLQAKLLRVLQTGEFERVGSSRTQRADVRVLSATNRDIAPAVASGEFREDLLFRLNTVEIRLPPLRQRREDIPFFAAHYLQKHGAKYRRPNLELPAETLGMLLRHHWPGNIRELDHVIERAVLMAEGDSIRPHDLALTPNNEGSPSLETMTLDDAERWLITAALGRHDGNVNEAAVELGVSRSALYRRIQRHGL